MKIKLDTRDKKPKLYGLLVQAVVFLIIVIYLDFRGAVLPATILATIVLFAAAVQLVAAFVRQIQYNLYSYNTIFYIGFALFLFVIGIMELVMTVQIVGYPVESRGTESLRILKNSASSFMFFSFPLLFLFSIGLGVSNLSLIRHEGLRIVNILGIVLAFVLVGGAVWYYFANMYVSGSEREVMVHDIVWNVFASVYLYFECMLIGAAIADFIAARYEPEPDKDFIIILGCGLRSDGTVTPLLRGRVDRALAFAKKQKEKTGKDLIFIPSGGQGPNEVVPESAAMKRYLLEQGVPEEQIVEEDQSSDTLENMKFSKEKILSINPEGKVAFSTTNYHVFRSGIFARRVKMRAVGMGAKTKWYFWPNAAVREFIGLVSNHRGKQIVILLSMIAVYTLLTVLNYQ